MMSKVDTFMRV